jgi:plasmid stability protein
MVPFRKVVSMATLTLKNVPDELILRLKAEARQNRRSVNQETLARLEVSLLTTPRDGRAAVAAAREFHQKMGPLPPITDAMIARARREGRP